MTRSLSPLPSPDVHELLLEVDVAEVEPDRLGASQPGGVDELDECAVAQRERPLALERRKLLVDRRGRGRIRKPACATWGEPRVGHARGAE